VKLEIEKDALAAIGQRRDGGAPRGAIKLQPDLIPRDVLADPVDVPERRFQIGTVERDDEPVAERALAQEALPRCCRGGTLLPARIMPRSGGTSSAPISSATERIPARRR
jgi:hypothetical protein